MRKVIFFNHMTLDGFFEGRNRDIHWTTVDRELNDYTHEQLGSDGLLLFGRVTYELMAGFWPAAEAKEADPITADYMNAVSKIVFSRTMEKAGWNNTRLVKGEAVEEIKKLKNQPGKDMVILGSSDLISALMREGLIDEMTIMLNPVILGSGNPLFHGLETMVNLRLIKFRTFLSGIIMLHYEVVKV
jgi:dihydrofolate reductase